MKKTHKKLMAISIMALSFAQNASAEISRCSDYIQSYNYISELYGATLFCIFIMLFFSVLITLIYTIIYLSPKKGKKAIDKNREMKDLKLAKGFLIASAILSLLFIVIAFLISPAIIK
jgi:hypothetical protein